MAGRIFKAEFSMAKAEWETKKARRVKNGKTSQPFCVFCSFCPFCFPFENR
jgi:hypothetical protein